MPDRPFIKNRWMTGLFFISVILSFPVLIITAKLFIPSEGVFSHLVETVLSTYLKNTLILMISVGILTFIIGTTLAWFVTSYDFPGRKIFKNALSLPIVIPPYILGYTYAGIFDYTGPVQYFFRNILNIPQENMPGFDILNMTGVVVIISLSFYPYVYIMVRSSMEKQSMRITEIATLFGHSPLSAFFRLILPLSRPAIAGGLSLVIMETLNDYGTVQYFGVDTFTTGIFRTWFALGDKDAAVHLAGILLLFVFLLIITERISRKSAKYDFSGMTFSPMKRVVLKGAKGFSVFLFSFLVLSAGFIIPAVQNFIWFFKTKEKMFRLDFLSPLINTFFLSLSSVILVITVAILLNYIHRLHRTKTVYTLNKINTLGYAVPGAITALGIMLIFSFLDKQIIQISDFLFSVNPGLLLSQSIFMLMFAFVVRFLTVGFNNIESGFSKTPISIHEASRTLGMKPLATLLKIDIPLIIPSILSGSILVFMELIRELPLSLILRPFNFDTLATKTYEYATDEMVRESSFFSVMIIILGTISLYSLTQIPRLNRIFQVKRSKKNE